MNDTDKEKSEQSIDQTTKEIYKLYRKYGFSSKTTDEFYLHDHDEYNFFTEKLKQFDANVVCYETRNESEYDVYTVTSYKDLHLQFYVHSVESRCTYAKIDLVKSTIPDEIMQNIIARDLKKITVNQYFNLITDTILNSIPYTTYSVYLYLNELRRFVTTEDDPDYTRTSTALATIGKIILEQRKNHLQDPS